MAYQVEPEDAHARMDAAIGRLVRSFSAAEVMLDFMIQHLFERYTWPTKDREIPQTRLSRKLAALRACHKAGFPVSILKDELNEIADEFARLAAIRKAPAHGFSDNRLDGRIKVYLIDHRPGFPRLSPRFIALEALKKASEDCNILFRRVSAALSFLSAPP